jgi:hypothetical protein
MVAIRNLDFYKVDKNLNVDKVGSKVGVIFSMLLVLLCSYKIVYQMFRMNLGLDDNQVYR